MKQLDLPLNLPKRKSVWRNVVDLVNHPPHYNKGGIECLDAIQASMSASGFESYLKGNVEKYVWRYEDKGKPLEDLRKAQFYLTKLIEVVQCREKKSK